MVAHGGFLVVAIAGPSPAVGIFKEDRRAIRAQGLAPGAAGGLGVGFPQKIDIASGIMDGKGRVAAHGDRLEPFGAHQGAQAGSAGGVFGTGDQAGETDPVFPGRADAHGLNPVVAKFFPDHGLGLAGLLAPQMGGVDKGDVLVFDIQIDRRGTFPGDHQMAEAGAGQFRAEIAAHVGVAEITAFGGFAGDVHPPAQHPGQQAGAEDQRAVGVEGIDAPGRQMGQVVHVQPPAAEKMFSQIQGDVLDIDFMGGQIDEGGFSVQWHINGSMVAGERRGMQSKQERSALYSVICQGM
ncbi:hypothetical protein DESC_700066 [Desulfosarcina cetonica]|nr:hypothetical protein DESC_700066 [Desulfosarcina cetonica]